MDARDSPPFVLQFLDCFSFVPLLEDPRLERIIEEEEKRRKDSADYFNQYADLYKEALDPEEAKEIPCKVYNLICFRSPGG